LKDQTQAKQHKPWKGKKPLKGSIFIHDRKLRLQDESQKYFTDCLSRKLTTGGQQINVLRPITRQFMDKPVAYLPVNQHKHPRHLETIAQLLQTNTVTIDHPGLKTPYPGLQTK
jgi:hypothetical protein